jgi:hypothetical protein
MDMKPLPVGAWIVFSILLLPALAVAAEPFDPEQPFREAATQNVLRSFLNHAMDVLEDHLEITGNFNPEDEQGRQRRHLKLRFYPEGKSNPDVSITAEGWFDLVPGSGQQDFHLRFSLPKPPAEHPSSHREDVL